MRTCHNCGEDNDNESDYCVSCGCSMGEPKVAQPFPSAFFAWAGLVIGILSTGYVFLISLPFYYFHGELGKGVMLWEAVVIMTAFWSFLLGLPFAIIGLIKGRRLIGWLGIAFILAPWPLGWAMFKTAMALNGFQLVE